MGRNHPLGVVIAALLFATLSQGGLAVNALVPKQLVDIITAVVIIAVVTVVPEVKQLLRSAGDAVRAPTFGRLQPPGTTPAQEES